MYDTIVVSETNIIGGEVYLLRAEKFTDYQSAFDYIRGKAKEAEKIGILKRTADYLVEANVFTMTMKSGNTSHYRVDVI